MIDDNDIELEDGEDAPEAPVSAPGFTADQVAEIVAKALADHDAIKEAKVKASQPEHEDDADAPETPAYLQADHMAEFRQDLLDEVSEEFPNLSAKDLRDLKSELRQLPNMKQLRESKAIEYHLKWAAKRERDNAKNSPPAATVGEPVRGGKPARERKETPMSQQSFTEVDRMLSSGKFNLKELTEMGVLTKAQATYVAEQRGA